MKDRIDYTPFYILADKKMQELYEVLKKNNHKEALFLIDDLLAEVRLMQVAIKSHTE